MHENDQDLMATRLSKLACSQCGHELDVLTVEPFSNVVCPECKTEMTVPVMLGSFLLVEKLGAGGMGAVYRALDATLNRFVAIKVLKTALGEDAKLVEGFLKEARAAAALNHRNIVQIYSCGQENGQPYIVMELVAGGRLDQMIDSSSTLPEIRMLEIGLDVAEGLRAAHDVGLIHSDIKPANILIDQSGTAKIVDFGLAHFVSAQQDKGEIWGTPYYISPERARGAPADHRSDIYSLGATLYHALAGKVPFDGKTAVDVVLARLKQPPDDLNELRPGLQPQTVALINRMMAVDSVMRYPTSASLMADMRSALNAAKAARSSSSGRRSATSSAGSKWIAMGATAMGVALIGGFLLWLRSLPDAEPVVRPVAPRSVEPTPPEPEADDDLAVTSVFEPEIETRLIEAVEHLVADRLDEALQVYRDVGQGFSRNDARILWIPVFQAIPLWLSREDAQALTQLSQVAERKLSLEEDHPAQMPRILAGWLVGRLDAQEFVEASRPWPAWYGDLARFYHSVMRLRITRGQQGLAGIEAFAGTALADPAWVVAYRDLARDVVDEAQVWRISERRIEAWLDAGRPEEAMAVIESLSALPSRYLENPLARLRSRAEAVQRQREEAEQALTARVDHRALQRDLARIDAAMAEQAPSLLRLRDYRKVSLNVSRLASDLETGIGADALALTRERVDQLEAFRTWLIDQVQATPYTRADGSDLGGDVIGANPVGLRISMDGRSGSIRPWEEIPLRSLIRMGMVYAGDSRMSSQDQAEAWLLLAVFCYVNGGPEVAAQVAQKAVDLDASVATRIRRLMPDVWNER